MNAIVSGIILPVTAALSLPAIVPLAFHGVTCLPGMQPNIFHLKPTLVIGLAQYLCGVFLLANMAMFIWGG